MFNDCKIFRRSLMNSFDIYTLISLFFERIKTTLYALAYFLAVEREIKVYSTLKLYFFREVVNVTVNNSDLVI